MFLVLYVRILSFGLLGLCTFPDVLDGKAVRVWTDNQSGECTLRRGSTASDDHNAIIHMTWHLAARANAGLFVHRVPTLPKIADCPSRGDYRLLNALRSVWRPPQFPCELWSPASQWLSVCVLRVVCPPCHVCFFFAVRFHWRYTFPSHMLTVHYIHVLPQPFSRCHRGRTRHSSVYVAPCSRLRRVLFLECVHHVCCRHCRDGP